MGIEPNSDRMWNAIGGIVIAGAIIGALTLFAPTFMKQMTGKFTEFMTNGFSFGTKPPTAA